MQATFSVRHRFTISLDYSSLTSQYAEQPRRNYVNIIRKYTHLQKVSGKSDHRGTAAANLLITLFHARDPRLIAYHVGSRVTNCAGECVIDLLVICAAGVLPSAFIQAQLQLRKT